MPVHREVRTDRGFLPVLTYKYQLWELAPDEFAAIVGGASSFADVTRATGDKYGDAAIRSIKSRCRKLDISLAHIPQGLDSNRGRKFSHPFRVETSKMLCENSTAHNRDVKNRILVLGLLRYECAKCDNDGEWQGERLALHLDHINGVNNDNRIENLRFLCPNCHSQTDTYAGRNRKSTSESS